MATLSSPDPSTDEAPDTQPDAVESAGVASSHVALEQRFRRARLLIGLLGVALVGALGFGALQFRKARGEGKLLLLRQKDAEDAQIASRADRVLRIASEPRHGHGNEALVQGIALVGQRGAEAGRPTPAAIEALAAALMAGKKLAIF